MTDSETTRQRNRVCKAAAVDAWQAVEKAHPWAFSTKELENAIPQLLYF